jgi:hypothetical protein
LIPGCHVELVRLGFSLGTHRTTFFQKRNNDDSEKHIKSFIIFEKTSLN